MATLLNQWFFDDGTSGVTPTTAVDGVGADNLAISFGTSANWDSRPSGLGIIFNNTTGNAVASSSTAAAGIQGLGSVSFIAVLRNPVGTSSLNRIFHIGSASGNGDLGLCVDDLSRIELRFNAETVSGRMRFPAIPAGVCVVVGVIDTSQADAASRVKLYANGTQLTPDAALNQVPAQNSLLPADMSAKTLCVGNRPDLTRQAQVGVYYLELYSGALTAQEVADASAALVLDHDADWTGATSPGTAPTFTAGPTATGGLNQITVAATATSPTSADIQHRYGLWPQGQSVTYDDVWNGTGAVEHTAVTLASGVQAGETFAVVGDDITLSLHWIARDTTSALFVRVGPIDGTTDAASETYSNVVFDSIVMPDVDLQVTGALAQYSSTDASLAASITATDGSARAYDIRYGWWLATATPSAGDIDAGIGAVVFGTLDAQTSGEQVILSSGNQLAASTEYRLYVTLEDADTDTTVITLDMTTDDAVASDVLIYDSTIVPFSTSADLQVSSNYDYGTMYAVVTDAALTGTDQEIRDAIVTPTGEVWSGSAEVNNFITTLTATGLTILNHYHVGFHHTLPAPRLPIPLTTDIGPLTFTRTGTENGTDYEGVTWTAAENQPVLVGTRYVKNLSTAAIQSFAKLNPPTGYTDNGDGSITLDGTGFVQLYFTTNNFGSLPTGRYAISITANTLTAGATPRRVFSEVGSSAVTIIDEPQVGAGGITAAGRYCQTFDITVIGSTQHRVGFANGATDTIMTLENNLMFESLVGKTNQRPSEYVEDFAHFDYANNNDNTAGVLTVQSGAGLNTLKGVQMDPATDAVLTATMVELGISDWTASFRDTIITTLNDDTAGDKVIVTVGNTTNGLELKVNGSTFTLTKYVASAATVLTVTYAFTPGEEVTIQYSALATGMALSAGGVFNSNANGTALAAQATSYTLGRADNFIKSIAPGN